MLQKVLLAAIIRANKLEQMVKAVGFSETLVSSQGRTKGRRAPGSSPPPNPKLKTHRFCRYYDIKSFTLFPVQPKSVTEIS
jgi:hypothetical protein